MKPGSGSIFNGCPRRPRSGAARARRSAQSKRPHDGILVQSPLPDAMGRGAAQRVFDAIDPDKDVDGFNPVNVGKLVQGRAHLEPCTPSGVIQILDRSRIPIAGRQAVVIGRSEIVGKPMAMLLLRRDATVTICHSKTPDLAAVSARADIVVAAIGRPGFVTRDFVKPGATVIDVGTTPVQDRHLRRAVVRRRFGAGRGVRSARLCRRWRRASRRRRGRRRDDPGSWRRRPPDDCDAPQEYRHRRDGSRACLRFEQ